MKPLSEKSLYKLYEQAKIKEEEKALLKKYLLCFSNLYGCIQICDLWDVFSSYHEPISKKKFFDFIDINQREENEYFILNLNEPYSAETSTKTKDKLLVNKLLVKRYTYKFNDLYTLEENKEVYHGPYIAPKELLFTFDHDNFYESDIGTEMVSFISNLKASGFRYCLYNDKKETLLDYNGNSVKSKCAKDFICYDFWEKYFLKAKRKNEKEYYQKRFTITCAQKILNKIKHAVLIDDADDLANSLKSITNLISYDFGLCFEEKDFEKFVKLYTDLINSTNRWSLFGFSSLELLKNEPVSNGPLQLQIGPNMQKMIDEGQLDLKEMEKHIKDNKLNISLTTKNKDVNEFETIIEENEKYLQEFKECLEKKKYDELSIDKHINRVEYYLNHYLMIGLPRRMEEGCSVDVDGFIRSKVNTSIIPPSVYNIDLFLTSIKLFYTCMVEKGYVKQSNLDEVTEITNDCKDEYISDYYDKNPKDISIEDVIELIQQAHGFGSAHINFKTGQSAIIPSDEELYCGNSDDLYDIIENPDWNKIYDIDDKEVMKQYVLQLDDEVKSEKLYTILQQNKSYKDFIDAIYDMDIVDDYFDFYASKIEELALEWLQDNLEDNDFVN